MTELQSWPLLLMNCVLATFWTCFMVVSMIYSLITKGIHDFFSSPDRSTRPKVLDDPELGTHAFIRLESGLRIHYVAAGDENKPLMLFLHGFPECWYSWRHQIRHFKKDYRTVAFDLRGYGESDKPSGISEYSVDKMGNDAAQLVNALGYTECVVVAHDWGGAVAQSFALLHPQLIKRLILVNIPNSHAFQQHIRENPSQLLKSWYMFFFQTPWLPELYLRSLDFKFVEDVFTKQTRGSERVPCTPEDVEAYKFSLGQKGGLTGPINYYRAALRYVPPKYPSKMITPPTLMVWGKKDFALEAAMAEKSAKYFEDFTLNYIEEAGHWSQMESPTKVNEFIANYLKARA